MDDHHSLGSAKEYQSPGLFSFKIREPGIRSLIYVDYMFLKLDVGSSLHFLW